jgi:hypothetical protein
MSARGQFLQRLFPRYLLPGSVIALCLTIWCGSASAYRPFDGTDAAVAAPGEVEIELQPAGTLRDEGGTSLVAPWTVFNYGLSEDWEAVFEGQGRTPLSSPGPTSLMAAGAFLKHVLQPGASRTSRGRASRLSLACCFRIAREARALARAWPALYRSAGIGERST